MAEYYEPILAITLYIAVILFAGFSLATKDGRLFKNLKKRCRKGESLWLIKKNCPVPEEMTMQYTGRPRDGHVTFKPSKNLPVTQFEKVNPGFIISIKIRASDHQTTTVVTKLHTSK